MSSKLWVTYEYFNNTMYRDAGRTVLTPYFITYMFVCVKYFMRKVFTLGLHTRLIKG